MKKITNTDISKNVNSIMVIGDVVFYLALIAALISCFAGVCLAAESGNGAYFLVYTILVPIFYIIMGIVSRISIRWKAYLLKNTLDIKNNVSKK